MCDTFYVPLEDRAFFGKNSDRKPGEPQPLCILPRGPGSPETAISGGSLPYPDKGYSVLLSKPSWIVGGEMGLNEKGVAIGNEAVFSRRPVRKDGVLGMDFLRAALRSADSAEDALGILIELTERFEQGGNGAYRGRLYYHNAYLVAGFDGAYVLETAARRWAWKALDGPSAISNSYSIGLDYKRLDPETRKAIAPVNESMACYDESDAGRVGEKAPWKPYVESRLHAFVTKGDARRRALAARVAAPGKDFGLEDAFGALRSRSLPDPARPGKTAVICAHDRDNLGYPSTASLVVEHQKSAARCFAWFTGTPYPDLSLYKPVVLEGGSFLPLWAGYDYAEDSPSSREYWERGRRFYRERGRRLSRDPGFRKARDEAQAGIRAAAAQYGSENLEALRSRISALAAGWEASRAGYR